MAYDSTPRARKNPLGELQIIEHVRTRASTTLSKSLSKSVRLGIGDDCAILRPPSGHEILVTTDFSLEGRHFRRDWHPAASAGHRTVARGLSDLAAMGAKPVAAFLSIALPDSSSENATWLDGFLDGLLALAKKYGVPLAGGDTSQSPSNEILADIVLIGSSPAGRALRRSSARAGDRIYCTGSLGGAAAELASLVASPAKYRNSTAAGDHPHLFPKPRLAVGQALLHRRLATSCIDLSDGLSTDLMHLCSSSNVSAEIDAACLPIHPLAQLDASMGLHAALHGGEDYELLFTAAPITKMPRSIGGVAITQIGRILSNRKGRPQVTLIDHEDHRSALPPQGWEHLR